MDSASIYRQLVDIQNQNDKYTPTSAGDIYGDLSRRVNNFQPQYQELRGSEAQNAVAPISVLAGLNSNFGTEGGGPDSMTRLATALGTANQINGTTNVLRDTLGQSQGRLENIGKNINDAYGQVIGQGQQKWNNTFNLYQTALQKEEAEKARRAAAAAAGGFNLGDLLGGGAEVTNGGGQTSPTAIKALSGAANKAMVSINDDPNGVQNTASGATINQLVTKYNKTGDPKIKSALDSYYATIARGQGIFGGNSSFINPSRTTLDTLAGTYNPGYAAGYSFGNYLGNSLRNQSGTRRAIASKVNSKIY
jgi:hypothetical protein